MASDRVKVDQMAAAIMEGLQDYADLATDDLKAAVKKAGSTVRKQIQQTAPWLTCRYRRNWYAGALSKPVPMARSAPTAATTASLRL